MTSFNPRGASFHKCLVTQLFWNVFATITSLFYRLRSKRIAFLESVNFSMCGYVQIFNFCDGHVTTFRHPSGAYICQMHGHRLQTSKRHTFRVSAFNWYHWFGVKLFAVGYAQDSRRVHLKCDKCCFLSGSAQATKFRNFY